MNSQQVVKVLIADDHPLVLESLGRILDGDDGFTPVGLLRGGTRVLDQVAATRPDMVLMDVHMPDLDGLSVLDLLRTHHPEVEVVLISAGADAGEIRSALRRGARGYLVKSINPNDIPAALRQIHEHTAYMELAPPEDEAAPAGSAAGAGTVEALVARTGLTPREVEILREMTLGRSNGEIAKELWVTEQTVKFHVGNIYRKLDAGTRVAAILIGVQAGLGVPADAVAA